MNQQFYACWNSFINAISANNSSHKVKEVLAAYPSHVVTEVLRFKEPSQGLTLLHLACFQQVEAVELLIAHGADVHAKNNVGATPLHCACLESDEGAAELLIAHGADVNAKDDDGWTPLHCAAKADFRHYLFHHDEQNCNCVIALLIKHGADIDAKNGMGDTFTDVADAAQEDYGMS